MAKRNTRTWIAVVGVCALVAGLSTGSARKVPEAVLTAAPPVTVAPTTTTSSTSTTTTTTLPPPAAVPSTTSTSIAVSPPASLVQGQWIPIGLVVDGIPTMMATLLAAPGGPLTGVVRVDVRVTKVVQFAGTGEPGGNWTFQGATGTAAVPALVAAFNGGFHTYESGGGWYAEGREAVPLRTGAASLVVRADGSATVGMLGRDVAVTPDVVSIRQNLNLLVDGGVDISDQSSWGAVLGGGIVTWRSGAGVDAAGNLIWAGGPSLTPHGLAQVLIQAGAVRGMQTDINPMWVSFSYYSSPTTGTDLLGGMYFGPEHWLYGSARDFFAVFVNENPTRVGCAALAATYLHQCQTNS